MAWNRPITTSPPSCPAISADAPHRRQREPVEEAVLDVFGQRLARVHGREEGALDEGDGEREGQVGVGREARDLGRRVEAGAVDREQEEGEDEAGDDHRRLAQGAQHGAAGQRADLGRQGRALAADGQGDGSRSCAASTASAPLAAGLVAGALEVAAGLLEEDVVEAGGVELDVGDPQSLGVERPDDVGDLLAAAVEADGDRLAGGRDPACRSARARPAAARPRRARRAPPRGSAGRSPPSATAGVPSATILPSSMIPTRSASWSASSRYWVVRKTVTPSSPASRATSSQSAARLCGSRPVVGSSRKRTRGPWTSASARSRRRFIPPE